MLVKVEDIVDTGIGPKTCAGNEACGASVDTSTGLITKFSASNDVLVKVEGIVGTGIGPRTIAGSEACGASVDTVSASPQSQEPLL